SRAPSWQQTHFTARQASVCTLPTKQACVFEGSRQFQPALAPTIAVREPPTTSRAWTHNETGRKRARQGSQAQTEKGIVSERSRIRSAHDDGERGFHRAFARSNGGES